MWEMTTAFLQRCHSQKWVTSFFLNGEGEFHFHIRVKHKGVTKDAMGWDNDLRVALAKVEEAIEKRKAEIDRLDEEYKKEKTSSNDFDDLL